MNLQHKPVSAALLQSLRGEMSHHPILVWLDLDDHYTPFVDALAQAKPDDGLPGPVLRHRGSYLDLMIQLDRHASDVDASPLLVHLPGANEDTVHAGPLLELYSAGSRFRKALETAVKDAALGRIPPHEVDEFIAQHQGHALTLDAADIWMASKVKVASNEIEAQLQGIKLHALIDDLLTGGSIAQQIIERKEYGLVWRALAARFGVPETWRSDINRDQEPKPIEIAELAASWAMCVEFVHDLARKPAASILQGVKELQGPFAAACREAAAQLRATDKDFYARVATEMSGLLEEELSTGSAADLGKIDTFKFEEELLYRAALHGLTVGNPAQAQQWAEDRLAGESFWLARDPNRKVAWRLVRAAARLRVVIAGADVGLGNCSSLREAAERYVQHGAQVDRLHRQLGQMREPQIHRHRIPHFEELRTALDAAEAGWEVWAEALAQDWTKLCEREGALPCSELQQRRVFDDVVAPLLADDEKTVYFMVDALRFEMAQELVELIGKQSATAINLAPRLAELPSVTEVGMNVLAPANDGHKLTPVLTASGRRFRGFKAAQFQITEPMARYKAIASRAGGTASPHYEVEEIVAMNATTLKNKLKNARLTVVHSIRIDTSGEAGTGYSVFGSELDTLRRAWKMLRDAGVRRFVFTADHGFLLRRPTAAEDQFSITHGAHHDTLARYALSRQSAASSQQIAVSFSALQYQGKEMHLLFPRGLHVYQSGAARNFVHGGNSPQERIIPVLTIRHKQPPGDDAQRYAVRVDKALSMPGGMHFVEAQVDAIRGELESSLFHAQETTLSLEVVGYTEVQHVLIDASGGASFEGRRLKVQIGQRFALWFRLHGPEARRVQIRLYHPDGNHQVETGSPAERFDVSAEARLKPKPQVVAETAAPPACAAPSDAPPVADEDWLAGYEDAGQRKVFGHIFSHGVITESEATGMLGSPRNWRRFVKKFEALKARAPFDVEVQVVNGETRYTKK
ncbi:MAG: BREX-6 system phosphatase PglZ [Nannocystaceae bacterium]